MALWHSTGTGALKLGGHITAKIKTACQLTGAGLAELRDTLDALARPASD